MTNAEKKARLNRLDTEIAKVRNKLNKRRAELNLEKRKRDFDRRPIKQRKVLEALGLSPYHEERIIHRECGTLRTK